MKRLHERKSNSSRLYNLKLHKIFTHKKSLVLSFSVIVLAGILSIYVTGYSSALVDIRPVVSFGSNETELTCNYKNEKESILVQTHSNINNYYKNLGSKNGAFENGDFSKFIFINDSDSVISDIANDIKEIGIKRNLSSDQLVELASCFVQNIPYDDAKGEYVLSDYGGNSGSTEQFPYETLHKNSGICTDKTYLGSLLIKELGYGTGIMLFPDAEHMALGIEVPAGYTDFGTKYMYAEMTTSELPIGEIPSSVSEANGRPAVSIKSVSDLKIEDNPSEFNFYTKDRISNPNLVIDVNDGKQYERIVEIVNLENSIIANYEGLLALDSTIDSAYYELIQRDSYQNSTYSTYLSTSDTTLDCGYKYNYSYSYSYYDYGYSSPYEYRCDTVTNPAKNRAYNTYSYAYDRYSNQVDHYNNLLDQYNSNANIIRSQVDRYKNYSY
jgi:hypothetical protein